MKERLSNLEKLVEAEDTSTRIELYKSQINKLYAQLNMVL